MYNFCISPSIIPWGFTCQTHLFSSKKVKKVFAMFSNILLHCLSEWSAPNFEYNKVSDCRQLWRYQVLNIVNLWYNNNDRFLMFCISFNSNLFSLSLGQVPHRYGKVQHSFCTFIQKCEAVFLLPRYTIQPFQRRNLKAEYNTEVEHYNHFCKVVSVRKSSF